MTNEEVSSGEFTIDANTEVEVTFEVKGAPVISVNNASFIAIDSDNPSRFSVAALNETKQVTFTVTITYDDKDFVFDIQKTILPNVTFVDSASLNSKTFVYSYTGPVYAGDSVEIPLTSLISYESGTDANGGEFTIDSPNANDVINSAEISAGNVVLGTRVSLGSNSTEYNTRTITYRKGDNYSFTFNVEFRLTVRPNVVASVNYPNPTGSEVLTAESITLEQLNKLFADNPSNPTAYTFTTENSTDDESKPTSVFVGESATFADGYRVVFSNAGSTVLPPKTYEVSWVSSKDKDGNDVLLYERETLRELSQKMIASGSTVTISAGTTKGTIKITYNGSTEIDNVEIDNVDLDKLTYTTTENISGIENGSTVVLSYNDENYIITYTPSAGEPIIIEDIDLSKLSGETIEDIKYNTIPSGSVVTVEEGT